MTSLSIEHVNITVADPIGLAERLCALFDWHIRWQGPAKDDGFTVHVGDDSRYLALYRLAHTDLSNDAANRPGMLNHVGILVEDLEAAMARVRKVGFKPFNFSDYEPGRRFYFMAEPTLEIEVVSYADPPTLRTSADYLCMLK